MFKNIRILLEEVVYRICQLASFIAGKFNVDYDERADEFKDWVMQSKGLRLILALAFLAASLIFWIGYFIAERPAL